jgi:lactoylglutathione lyase
MPETTALPVGHVGINVTDLDRSIAFYRALLGHDVLATSPDPDQRWALLGSGGAFVVTLWEQARGDYDASRAGLHHLSFQVPDGAAVAAAADRLRGLGVEPLHGGVVAQYQGSDAVGVFFHDPDGTRLEVSCAHGSAEADAPFGAAPTCGFF